MSPNRIRLKGIEIELLDLGCGHNVHNGIGIDILDQGQAIVWDLRKGIPLPDSCVKSFWSAHFLEHLTREELYPLFDEIQRVAVDGATMRVIVPHAQTDEADFMGHLSCWDEKRVRGIVLGFRGAFELLEMKRNGMELHFKLKINK